MVYTRVAAMVVYIVVGLSARTGCLDSTVPRVCAGLGRRKNRKGIAVEKIVMAETVSIVVGRMP